jgi:hypothetical protein
MDELDHALAARRHADEAMSGSGGDDPVVLASLAQTEALLAVAAAIDRLAEAFGRREASPAPGLRDQPNHITEARRQYPQAYKPWTAEADAALLAAHRAGHDAATLADTFGRQPSTIRSRLTRLGLFGPGLTTPAADPRDSTE